MADKNDETIITMSAKDRFISYWKFHWRGTIIFLVPLIFLFLIFMEPPKAMRCAFLLIVMAIFWVSEVIPVYVTALFPIIAFPLIGIISSEDVCQMYLSNIVMFFFMSMAIAIAVEYSNLHTRIALNFINLIGCGIRRLHFSIMTVTLFLSMWMSNSATTAMVCPIIRAILDELSDEGFIRVYKDKETTREDEKPHPTNVTMCFYLSVAYAATIGGLATIIGSGANLVFVGLISKRFPGSHEITFMSFMLFNMPVVLLNGLLVFVWMEFLFMGLFRKNSDDAKASVIDAEGRKAAEQIIKRKIKELGRLSFHEAIVGFFFILMIFLLFFRKPGFIDGYADVLNEKKIGNSTPTAGIVFVMFALPSVYRFLKYYVCKVPNPKGPARSVLEWSVLHNNFPWGLFFLFGGGIALATGIQRSGLAVVLGNGLSTLKTLPSPLIQLIVIYVTIFITAFVANVPVANIVVPIVNELSVAIRVNPLYLSFPVGIAACLAFHLPVSTPPNAIILNFAAIRTKHMFIAGIGPTLITTLLYFTAMHSLGPLIFPNLYSYPEWANEEVTN